ncbi:MAG: hypothetical protein WBD40_01365 [Tepidisphaeraceae bacterium]
MPVAEKRERRSTDAPRKGDKTTTDFVCEYMHEHCKSLTIDTLLTRPHDAMCMGLAVARSQQRINAGRHKAIAELLAQLAAFTDEMDAIDDVCRAALNGRKHGDIKRDRY